MNPNRRYKLAREIANIQFLLEPERINLHISFIVFSKSLVYGINSTKTHPRILREYGGFKQCLHSEMDALLKIQNVTEKNKVLVNFRYSRTSELPKMSKPCVYCQMWIPEVFEHVYYTNEYAELTKMY